MKIFVTGGTGFIGSHFVNQAMTAGHEVVVQRRSFLSKPRIELAREPQWIDAQIDEVKADSLEGCDCLVHLAAHTPNVPYDTLETCIKWNVVAPLRLFRNAMSIGINHFVVAGSCFEYGRSGDRYESIPIDAPLEPTQSYPASKAMASIAFSQLAIEYNLRLSIHRIFQAYGEGEAETRFWPSLRRAALSGEDFPMSTGEQIRDFIHVRDVASQLLNSMVNFPIPFGKPTIRHVASGNAMSLKEFAEYWWNHWNASGQLLLGAKPQREGEIMRYVPKLDESEVKSSKYYAKAPTIK